MSDDIGRTAVAIIRDLMGPTASLSATNCRVVEDHLRALVAAVNALPTLLDRLSAMPAAGESSEMPIIWEDPAGKGYPCFSRPMTPREARQTIEKDGERIVALEEALHQIDQWSRAYPLKAFPEPDFARCAELLKAGGQTLGAVSASNMRHVVEGVGKIARAALGGEG